jgi:dTDP-4-dehydrorhamnose reductase
MVTESKIDDRAGGGAILITGANGVIGEHLANLFERAGRRVIRTARTEDHQTVQLNLADDLSTWRPPQQISLAYLCAGATSLDYCRRNSAESFNVNVKKTVQLAEILIRQGAKIVFPSSNLVFDGSVPFQKADAAPNPKVEYGRQKAEAEKRLRDLGAAVTIVRLTKVLRPGKSLLTQWREALLEGRTIHPFSDMVMSPLTLDFATEVLRIAGLAHTGEIIQASGSQDITYERAAIEVAREIGASSELIQPVRAGESGINFEHLPKHTTLSCSKYLDSVDLSIPDPLSAVRWAISDKPT